MKENKLQSGIKGITPGSQAWRTAMTNANRANDNYVPNYIRNNKDVKRLVSEIRNKR